MSAPHSPLPWHVLDVGAIFDAHGEGVYMDSENDKEIANANLIVTAVNAHPALLVAAKEALEVIENTESVDSRRICITVVALKTAIAKAEEHAV